MVAYAVMHVFDFTNVSVAIDTAALASSLTTLHQTCPALGRRECFVVLSHATPQTVNMQREARLTTRKVFCSLSSLTAGFCRQQKLGGWVWLRMVC